ncbi:hypothetical protein PR202_ga11082 [Eleusine coracana subsp. coracana]|uniref:Sugar phosphate transporter domain-containing protein n=1 Tax=Eleusine coracana subsp. coracana TaxID=191504 RepID=A0AAV5C8G0_ELECO|nr:hypothetical protein PR202_ga11082 [Eleusine coracana subsp. coracana]
MNSMDLLRYMAPVAIVLLVPATLVMERDAFGVVATLAREDPSFIWILVCNSSLAYFVNLTNFLVTKHTSPLTLQVLGNAKGAVAVVISILIFRNPVTVVGMLGYGITVAGVVLYGEAKKRNKEKMNSMDLLRYMAPVAIILLVPTTLVMKRDALDVVATLAREDRSFIWILVCNSSLAYFVNLTNFLVTKHTSPLTLQVLGNAKGIVAVVVSILIFRNPVTVVGMLGYGVTVAGVVLYGEAKKRNK